MSIFLENTKLALISIWSNKVRSLLTILGVVIGVFAIITIIAIGSGLKEEIVGQISSLGSDILDIVPGEIGEGMGSAVALQQGFNQKDVDALKKDATLLKGIAETYQFAGSFKYGNKDINGFTIGTDPEYFKLRDKGVVAGRLFSRNDNVNRDNVTVIGHETAIKLFGEPERSINRIIRVNGIDFKVIGVLEEENLGFGGMNADQAVYLPSLTTHKYFPDISIREILAKVKDEELVNRAKRQVEIILTETRGDSKFTVLGQESILNIVDSITGTITTALAGLASISLVVGGIGIMNIMLVSVTERTKEIGIRKAIGATDTHILIQFLTESVALCLMGGLVGLLAAAGVSSAITYYFSMPTFIGLQTVLGAIGFSITVGVVFGTTPALKAARKDPVDALRHE